MVVNFSDIEMAFEFVSSGYGFDHSAWLDKESGHIYYDSDSSEDILPDDLYENDKYIQIPEKRDFGLGKPLALKFAGQYMPEKTDMVRSAFQSRGAYSKFKDLLENLSLLDKWYTYEESALEQAIKEWCHENSIEISI